MPPWGSRRVPVGWEISLWSSIASVVEFVTFQEQHGVSLRLPCAVADLPPGSHRTVMDRQEANWFSTTVALDVAPPDTWYAFAIDGLVYPDQASRRQPVGPLGPSMLVDPVEFTWSDSAWCAPAAREQVIYELHVGTFTPAGTFAAAATRFAELRDLGVTTLELMPVADFAGGRGWGYDGVGLFAPFHGYGTPSDMRAFVDSAHGHGLAVILDVVYNHFGPAGNFLPVYAPQFITDRWPSDWGDSLDFSEPAVRAFFRQNVRHWVGEFHLDGLRFDATHAITDDDPHILGELTDAAREAVKARSTATRVLLCAETETQEASLLAGVPDGGYGFDAIWTDDFHHAASVAATGRHEAYLADFCGSAQELLAATLTGSVFQGQWSTWQERPRGGSTQGIEPWRFVHYLENHDQIANSLDGARIASTWSPAVRRALTALLLLGPAIPLLFQGQDRASPPPFVFFADHEGDLQDAIRAGRQQHVGQFSSAMADIADMPDPCAPETFARCVWTERPLLGDGADAPMPGGAPPDRTRLLHRDLIHLRADDEIFTSPLTALTGATVNDRCLVLRWQLAGQVRLLVVNLGTDLMIHRVGEPLVAPPNGGWATRWSSESTRYGGHGSPVAIGKDGLVLGGSAVLLGQQPAALDGFSGFSGP